MAASPAGRQGGAAAGRPGAESRQGELANLAYLAFDGAEPAKLMAKAARVVRKHLGVEFSSVMQLSADRDELLLRAGEGWRDGAVGRETLAVGVSSDVGYVSMAAYALWDKNPVRVEDLAEDPRFEGCPLMVGHGVVSGVMAKIRVGGRVFGTIGAHSRSRRVFVDEEAEWLADLAKMLGGGLGHLGHGRRAAGCPDPVLQDTMEQIAASAGGGGGALVETARIAATELADWCFVDLLETAVGSLPGVAPGNAPVEVPELASHTRVRRIAIGGGVADENGQRLAEEFSYPLDPAAPHGTPKVLKSGRPELIRRVGDDVLRRGANDPVHLGPLRRLRPLKPHSYMVVPIRLFLRTVGALVLVSTDPARLFDEDSLERAEQLAGCAALILAGCKQQGPSGAGLAGPPLASDLDGQPAPARVHVERRDPPDDVAAAAKAAGLQPRQLDVLRLLNAGHTPKEIAARLYCTEANVRKHLKRINRALGVGGQVAALARARELGLIAAR
jgi:DNA-binding CsgD family transcriptional regulator/GAF domain-containing protein